MFDAAAAAAVLMFDDVIELIDSIRS